MFGSKTKQLVEIVFDDPAEFDTNYDTKLEPIECKTIGWLEEKTVNMIRISWLRETDNSPYVGLAIPVGCVKEMNILDGSKQDEVLN